MNRQFQKHVQALDGKWTQLRRMSPVPADGVPPKAQKGGIYVFYDKGRALYAGRTKRSLTVRIREHFGAGLDCPFAWLLAREMTGKKRTYRTKGSRNELLNELGFRLAYELAKCLIRDMDVRYVHERNPLKRALLEIYVATAERAVHNDFEEH